MARRLRDATMHIERLGLARAIVGADAELDTSAIRERASILDRRNVAEDVFIARAVRLDEAEPALHVPA